jgi:Wzt C-terminal domain
VQAMCTRAIWLDHGEIKAAGGAESVVRQYQGFDMAAEAVRLAAAPATPTAERWGTRKLVITRARLTDEHGHERTIFQTGQPLVLHLEYEAHRPVEGPIFGMAIHRQDGAHITGPNTQFGGLKLPTLSGRGEVTFTIPALPLLEGLYHISAAAVNADDTEMFDFHDRAYPFRVVNLASALQERYGLITVQGEWAHVPDRRD